MTAYYNEIDPYAAGWLRQLIKEGRIADGEVDTRSIVDVRPSDLVGFTQCHFFAGLGGWGGALRLAGFPDDRPVWTGSCPCQPFSLAGKQKGFADERHLWPIWRELIAERRPAKVYGEQVASASDWLRLVRGDLEALDYAVGAIPIEAASSGADHLRDRYWFVANDGSGRCAESSWRQGQQPWRTEVVGPGDTNGIGMADADSTAIRIEPGRSSGPCGTSAWQHRDDSQVDLADCAGSRCGNTEDASAVGRREGSSFGETRAPHGLFELERDGVSLEWVIGADGKARRVKSGIRLLAHGIPARVAKLRALGNAIDLRPAAAFIRATM